MRGDLYNTDILEWAEQQARLLRRHAAGEHLNERPDWLNIAQEIEDMGRAHLHAVQGLLIQALRHMLKAEAWPHLRDAPNWRADAIYFHQQARRQYVPSMLRKLDVAGLYDEALRALPETVEGQPPLPVPSLQELLEVWRCS